MRKNIPGPAGLYLAITKEYMSVLGGLDTGTTHTQQRSLEKLEVK